MWLLLALIARAAGPAADLPSAAPAPAPAPAPMPAPATEPTPEPAPWPPGVVAARLERGHLVRVGVLAGASAVASGALLGAGWHDDRLRWAGLTTAGVAVTNGIIVAAAWRGTGVPKTPAELARTREVFQLNVGLDAGYVGAGVAMGVLGRLDDRGGVEGAGWAIAAQGVSLLVLDAVVLAKLPHAF